MARKFRKASSRALRKRPIKRSLKRGRRRLGEKYSPFSPSNYFDDIHLKAASVLGKAAYDRMPPLKSYKGRSFRGTAGRRKKAMKTMAPAGTSATIKTSPGLVIGASRPLSWADKIRNVQYPPTHFNSKWTFQMDCYSGRVSAAQIPIMTQALAQPLLNQLFSNLLSDVGGSIVPPTVQTNATFDDFYKVMIKSYVSKIRLYNSSTNTLRARIVWYKPRRDADGEYLTFGANSTDPINMLMIAQNAATAALDAPGIVTTLDGGMTFDAVTTGANYQANYNHAGCNLTGSTTATGNITNTVARLDPALVPGSPQVKKMFSAFWTTLKSEEFQLEPGQQINTQVRMRNRIVKNFFQDSNVKHREDATVIGVVYVLGQMVFSGVENINTVTTGSSQLSIMREDFCSVQPMITKKTCRVNLTNQYEILADADQEKINDETGDIQTTFTMDR